MLKMALAIDNRNPNHAISTFHAFKENIPKLRKKASALDKISVSSSFLKNKRNMLSNSYKQSFQMPRQITTLPNKSVSIKSKNRQVYHLITEDHEISISPGKSFGKPSLSIYEADIQLIRKGRIINRLAKEYGIVWTHLIDIGSYMLISNAARHYPKTWGVLVEQFHDFLTETISTGNDLGVHIHTDKSPLVVTKYEENKVWLASETPSWGELKGIGSINDPLSKLGMVVAGKNLVEKYGKKADASFEACFFRAGSYKTGTNYEQTYNSMKAILLSGLKISSDALLVDGITASLGRPSSDSIYFAKLGSPWQIADINNEEYIIQALPTRTANLPVYSVLDFAKQYNRNPDVLNKLVNTAINGNGFLISIDHDININSSLKESIWDDLDEKSNDWLYLKNYFNALSKMENVKFITTREFLKLITDAHLNPEYLSPQIKR